MLIRLAPDMRVALANDFTAEDFKFLSELPINKDLKLSEVLVALLDALNDVGRSFIPELPVELAVAKLFEGK